MRRAKELSSSNPDLLQQSAYSNNHDVNHQVQNWNDIPVPLRNKSGNRQSRPRSANLDIVNVPLVRASSKVSQYRNHVLNITNYFFYLSPRWLEHYPVSSDSAVNLVKFYGWVISVIFEN